MSELTKPGGLSEQVESVIDRASRLSPLQLIFERRARRRLTVLSYHGIEDPDQFEGHLGHLVRKTHPVTLDQVVQSIRGGVILPDRAVLLTFDDGDRSVLDVALPMLRARGIPGVVFVVAGLLDTAEPFWWTEVESLVEAGATLKGTSGMRAGEVVRSLKQVSDDKRSEVIAHLRRSSREPAPRRSQLRRDELKELESGGIVIGNHTLTHPCLPQCSDSRLVEEIRDAHHIIESALGRSPTTFAYPNGDLDPRAEVLLRNLGYDTGFLFDHRTNALPIAEPMRVSRVRVNSTTSMDRFRTILSGLHPTIHYLLGRS